MKKIMTILILGLLFKSSSVFAAAAEPDNSAGCTHPKSSVRSAVRVMPAPQEDDAVAVPVARERGGRPVTLSSLYTAVDKLEGQVAQLNCYANSVSCMLLIVTVVQVVGFVV